MQGAHRLSRGPPAAVKAIGNTMIQSRLSDRPFCDCRCVEHHQRRCLALGIVNSGEQPSLPLGVTTRDKDRLGDAVTRTGVPSLLATRFKIKVTDLVKCAAVAALAGRSGSEKPVSVMCHHEPIIHSE
mgnify:CR=1 FL=1